MRAFLCLTGVLLSMGAQSLFAQATLRPGDIVDIRLSGVPTEEIQQFSAQYTIDEQGMLNLPYINQIRAAELAPNQLQIAIQNKLMADEIYSHPTITVQTQAGYRFVNVGGSVRAPGRIPYTTDLTLMSTINAAGGFNDFADQKRVRLVHENKVQVYDTRKIRKDPSLDPRVYPGDQVEVPQSLW
jgi:protein involved in polysaccharide export with SLBB domain